VSTEQRDKVGKVIHQATRLRDRLVREANKPLDVEIVGVMGQMIDLLESAHAATMPDRRALEEALDALDWTQLEHGIAPTNSEIIDAVLALLNKEGD